MKLKDTGQRVIQVARTSTLGDALVLLFIRTEASATEFTGAAAHPCATHILKHTHTQKGLDIKGASCLAKPHH